jgi:hypothetical protein
MGIDFSEIDDMLKQVDSFIKDEVVPAMVEAGESAVDYAIQNGEYKNRTGTLRKSNKYLVDKEGLLLYNDATSVNGEASVDFADMVIDPDKVDVVTGTPDGKIVQYASFVEAKGYDVLSGAALHAEKLLKDKFER